MKHSKGKILAMAKALYREYHNREMPKKPKKTMWLKQAERYLNLKAKA